jgi:quercetin dioxygenase-like cupin family protein
MTGTTSPRQRALVLHPAEIADLPETPLGALHGVRRRVLWQSGNSESGVLDIAAGNRLGLHAHRANQHHLWVLSGAADIAGQRVPEGGYAHIPAGIEHDIDATATEGCSLLYLYLGESA